MAEYTIHEDNIPRLIKKLKTIENKCKKYGCNFTFAEIGEEFRNVKIKENEIGKHHFSLERYVIVEVEGKAIINDWQFIATLEHTENGNIIRNVTNIELPGKYLNVSPTCEHCNSNRYRKDTYIVQNTTTGEYKQVGKSCLKSYTNGMDAQMIANYLSYFDLMIEFNNKESKGGFTREYIEINNYLLIAAEVIKNYGFLSKGKANEINEYERKVIPTTERINFFMEITHGEAQKIQKREMDRINYNPDCQENQTAVNNALNWIINLETNGGYLHNLKMVCLKEYAEYRDYGILASLLPAYYKAMETEQQRKEREELKANKKQSEYIGEIKEKISFSATIKFLASYETQYGYTNIYKFIDNNGNVYIWKTGTYIEDSAEYKTITATVKNHSEYNNEKQTEILRVKIK